MHKELIYALMAQHCSLLCNVMSDQGGKLYIARGLQACRGLAGVGMVACKSIPTIICIATQQAGNHSTPLETHVSLGRFMTLAECTLPFMWRHHSVNKARARHQIKVPGVVQGEPEGGPAAHAMFVQRSPNTQSAAVTPYMVKGFMQSARSCQKIARVCALGLAHLRL